MAETVQVTLTSAEIDCLLEAIEDAQAELCLGPPFKEANAYNDRLEALTQKLMAAAGPVRNK